MVPNTVFSGSFKPDDIRFLLSPLVMDFTSVEEKELLLQSGKAHYSDMLSEETAPGPLQLAVFRDATARYAVRLRSEVAALAYNIAAKTTARPIVLASLVRAGAPLGVLLLRELKAQGVDAVHYGISIIRDRGIDDVALSELENKYSPEHIVFVDGWVGKGAITAQLKSALVGRAGYHGEPKLAVLADPCHIAWLSASDEDWLIPFGILGAPVAGLISRSVFQQHDFHGCVQYDNLKEVDQSQWFVDTVSQSPCDQEVFKRALAWERCAKRTAQCERVIQYVMDRFNVTKRNYVKPGVAEATRAVMRRVPDVVVVSDKSDPDLAVLLALCEQKGAKVIEVGKVIAPYRAVTVIKKVV